MVNELQARYLCWQKLETEKLTRMTEIFETNNEPHKNAEITSLLSYHRTIATGEAVLNPLGKLEWCVDLWCHEIGPVALAEWHPPSA